MKEVIKNLGRENLWDNFAFASIKLINLNGYESLSKDIYIN